MAQPARQGKGIGGAGSSVRAGGAGALEGTSRGTAQRDLLRPPSPSPSPSTHRCRRRPLPAEGPTPEAWPCTAPSPLLLRRGKGEGVAAGEGPGPDQTGLPPSPACREVRTINEPVRHRLHGAAPGAKRGCNSLCILQRAPPGSVGRDMAGMLCRDGPARQAARASPARQGDRSPQVPIDQSRSARLPATSCRAQRCTQAQTALQLVHGVQVYEIERLGGEGRAWVLAPGPRSLPVHRLPRVPGPQGGIGDPCPQDAVLILLL